MKPREHPSNSGARRVHPVEGLLFICLFLLFPIPLILLIVYLRHSAHGNIIPQVLASITRYIVIMPLVIFYFRRKGVSLTKYLGLSRKGSLRALLKVPGIALQAACIMIIVNLTQRVILTWMGVDWKLQTSIKILKESGSGLLTFLIVISAVVLAPVVEEILFRGLFFKSLCETRGRNAGYFFSAFIFALCHFNRFAFIPLFVLAIILAWSYEKTGKIIVPMSLHFIQNAFTISVILMGG